MLEIMLASIIQESVSHTSQPNYYIFIANTVFSDG